MYRHIYIGLPRYGTLKHIYWYVHVTLFYITQDGLCLDIAQVYGLGIMIRQDFKLRIDPTKMTLFKHNAHIHKTPEFIYILQVWKCSIFL